MIYWNSFAEFLAMGKHGVYVWGSCAAMASAMLLEPFLLKRQQRQVVQRLQRQYRAEAFRPQNLA